MEPTHVKDVILALFREMGDLTRTPAEAFAHFSEDGEWWVAGSTPLSGTMTKPQLLESFARTGEIADSVLQLTAVSWLIDGDTAAVEAISQMRLRSGKTYNNAYHFKTQVKGDKVFRVKEYMDTAHVMDAFGFAHAAPSNPNDT